ncbi:Protein bem46, putative [Perkinsus marinus ATCC 50983]|uniref:Protein bem46, putative n=1 Tax=Perkinsus marinus (strain ATCC 50983 / TXsc) TaxID=423536 RepID=C5KIT6_PERM5|nr:Protein bem46, putative [Perkinsus marinus ATCC 50983]EER15607.1 Protein bem46, putative [Perkinsus marinus ATCC 50983]|eukprot:XP_002783811.1 Protein bem46, putative [Perkinsus marinus ATCC 50983]
MNAFVIIGGVLGVLLLSMSWTKVLLICLGVVATLLAILVASQEKMLYMPEVQGFTTVGSNPPGMRSPVELDMKFENIKVATADGQSIHAWFIHAIGVADSSMAPTIVFCHANAGNMGLRMPNYRQLASFVKANVLAFDYRGFGESTGKPSEEGIMLDLDALFQWIQNNQQLVDPENIFLFGRSLGGAVAAEYAAKLVAEGHPPRGVILENTFLSISLMVNSLFPFLRFDWVKKPFLRLRWETYKHVEKLGKK